MFKYHIIALLLGTILEYVCGKIYYIWNPFDTIKKLIRYLDRALLGDEIILLEPSRQKSLGMWLIILVLLPVFIGVAFFSMLFYEVAPVLGIIFEAFATYLCLEGNYIFFGAYGVMQDYYGNGVDAMAESARMFTGQDIESTSEQEITEKVLTHVANETTDSCLSPLFIMFLFGPIGGFLYRTIDIIDGEIGYKNSRYQYFGYYAARLNRLVSYIPDLFNGKLTVFASKFTFGTFNSKNAKYIQLRDKCKAISAYAGALDVSLKNGTVGDADKNHNPQDIRRAIGLLKNTFIIYQVFFVILLLFF